MRSQCEHIERTRAPRSLDEAHEDLQRRVAHSPYLEESREEFPFAADLSSSQFENTASSPLPFFPECSFHALSVERTELGPAIT